jgi:hypothetical protein
LSKRIGRVHCVIPDGQVRPGVDLTHWKWVGNYIAAKKPDVIVNIGDFADMVSLNSYQVGKADAEGTRYEADINSARNAMSRLTGRFSGIRNYHPDMVLTLGNHEDRITREAQNNPRLIGTISVRDLGYEQHGWKVHDFLKIVKIDRIAYSHYFISGAMGRPVSSAAALLRTRQQSCVMGHVQRIDMAIHPFTQNIALFSGICYTHDENYLTPQGNNTKRGIWMLNEVRDGTFDPMFVSLAYLRRNYG